MRIEIPTDGWDADLPMGSVMSMHLPTNEHDRALCTGIYADAIADCVREICPDAAVQVSEDIVADHRAVIRELDPLDSRVLDDLMPPGAAEVDWVTVDREHLADTATLWLHAALAKRWPDVVAEIRRRFEEAGLVETPTAMGRTWVSPPVQVTLQSTDWVEDLMDGQSWVRPVDPEIDEICREVVTDLCETCITDLYNAEVRVIFACSNGDAARGMAVSTSDPEVADRLAQLIRDAIMPRLRDRLTEMGLREVAAEDGPLTWGRGPLVIAIRPIGLHDTLQFSGSEGPLFRDDTWDLTCGEVIRDMLLREFENAEVQLLADDMSYWAPGYHHKLLVVQSPGDRWETRRAVEDRIRECVLTDGWRDAVVDETNRRERERGPIGGKWPGP